MGQSNRLSLSRQKKGKSCRTIEPFSKVEIAAHDEILLTAKGSYTKINVKGIEHGTPKAFTWYTPTLGMPGPKSMPVQEYVSKPYKGKVQFLDDDGQPRAGYDYIAYNESHVIDTGTTDSQGWTKEFFTVTMEEISVHLLMMGFDFVEHEHDEECGC